MTSDGSTPTLVVEQNVNHTSLILAFETFAYFHDLPEAAVLAKRGKTMITGACLHVYDRKKVHLFT
jgi:hypothetical protein